MAKGGDPKILSHQAENLCTFEFDFEPLISPPLPPKAQGFHTHGWKNCSKNGTNFFYSPSRSDPRPSMELRIQTVRNFYKHFVILLHTYVQKLIFQFIYLFIIIIIPGATSPTCLWTRRVTHRSRRHLSPSQVKSGN